MRRSFAGDYLTPPEPKDLRSPVGHHGIESSCGKVTDAMSETDFIEQIALGGEWGIATQCESIDGWQLLSGMVLAEQEAIRGWADHHGCPSLADQPGACFVKRQGMYKNAADIECAPPVEGLQDKRMDQLNMWNLPASE